ncbi:MAG TPA: glycosyltransferase family 4 protein [Terriglobales bacterium]|nr:glycosyltransferase family 4 protein [Terriglobales bacterium]
MAERLRILVIATHPIQYGAPFFRAFSSHSKVDLTVAYCSLRGAEPGYDSEFNAKVSWDIPLLEGYRWLQVPNRPLTRNEESFFGLCNPGVWKLVRSGGFDAVISYMGYRRSSFWFAVLGAKTRGIPILFGTDASSIVPRETNRWKRGLKLMLKRMGWRAIFCLSDQIITASQAGSRMMESLGFPSGRISMTLDTVDNDWWLAQAAKANRDEVRTSWGMERNDVVILFCAKLQGWKRPGDLLEAFAMAKLEKAWLVFAGDGQQRSELEELAKALRVSERVRFLGFVNQSHLPGIYAAADLMVLPSEYEPFGLVVNEAMLCGCPVLASDRVGAAGELIEPGKTGFVCSCGDVEGLSRALREILADQEALNQVARRARERMKTWSYHEATEAMLDALNRALARKGRKPAPREKAAEGGSERKMPG